MSQADQIVAEIIQAQFAAQIASWADVGAAALLFYHVLSTFTDDVRYIGSVRFSLPTLLFIVIRYGFVITESTVVWFQTASSPSDEACTVVQLGQESLGLIVDFSITLVFAIRIFAIYGKSWTVFALVILAGLGPVVTDGGIFSLALTASGLPRGCTSNDFQVANLIQIWSLASAGTTLFLDILILALTLGKTLVLQSQAKQAGTKNRLVNMLQRDGIVYFFSLLLIKVISVTILLTPSVPINLAFVMPPFNQILSVILVTELMRNLRRGCTGDFSTLPTSTLGSGQLSTSAIMSTVVVGNLGAPLNVGDSDSIWIDDGTGEEDVGLAF